jgi:hypothetical protein
MTIGAESEDSRMIKALCAVVLSNDFGLFFGLGGRHEQAHDFRFRDATQRFVRPRRGPFTIIPRRYWRPRRPRHWHWRHGRSLGPRALEEHEPGPRSGAKSARR